jgi:beta-mannosidase
VLAFDIARLTAAHITQDHSQPGVVGLHVAIDVERTNADPLLANVTVAFEGVCACQVQSAVQANATEVNLTVTNPKLWWPNDLGEHPLYDVTVELFHDH